jgi:hypothetical protein
MQVIAIAKSTKFLLTSSVPDIEDNVATVGIESETMYLNSESWHIRFLEFTRDVPLRQGCFPYTTVANKDQLELNRGNWCWCWSSSWFGKQQIVGACFFCAASAGTCTHAAEQKK